MGSIKSKTQSVRQYKKYVDGYDYTQLLIVYAWFRDITKDENKKQHDYGDLIRITYSYYAQGFAAFFQNMIDADIKQFMSFGDILRTTDGKYMVMATNKDLITVGDDMESSWGTYTRLTIPNPICKYLSNAPSFYSKCAELKNKSLRFDFLMHVNHDDQWIMKHLGNALNSHYKYIDITFMYLQYLILKISITDNEYDAMPFDPITNKIHTEDIDEFFRIRKHTKELVKISVSPKNRGKPLKRCQRAVSILWSVQREQLVGGRVHYFGPRSQKESMIKYLKSSHKKADIKMLMIHKDEIKNNFQKILWSYLPVEVVSS